MDSENATVNSSRVSATGSAPSSSAASMEFCSRTVSSTAGHSDRSAARSNAPAAAGSSSASTATARAAVAPAAGAALSADGDGVDGGSDSGSPTARTDGWP